MRKKMPEYRRVIRFLKKQCPAAFPVLVRRVKLKNCYGRCSYNDDHFHIEIHNKLDERFAIDTLLHEWAHTLAWSYRHELACYSSSEEEFQRTLHDANWGVAYAEVYRAYMGLIAN